MSVNEKAERHAKRIILAFLCFIPWMLISTRLLQPEWAAGSFAVVWISLGLWSYRYVCPNCGYHVFRAYGFFWPWPRSECWKCRHDLTEEPLT